MAAQIVPMINTELPDILELKNIRQVYKNLDGTENVVIDGLNLLIEDSPGKGEFIVLLGSSGCGKSHILRYLSGIQTPTSGEVLISSRPRVSTDYVGMVFQGYSSFEYYTVLENVALGLEYRGVPKKERESKAIEIIEKVGLKGHENKFAKAPTLSGGQLQRVAIARSLAYGSKILLMDEPFGAIIMVTHAIDEAVYLGDRIYVMGGSPSNIVKEFISPLPLIRNRGMKREPSFINMVQEIEDFMMIENCK
jgi:NitT/TauT family transport system ATP-binding protein